MDYERSTASGKLSEIAAFQLILDVVCSTTGMGYAAIARITEDRWIAWAARDDIGLGVATGQELPAEATFCGALRHNPTPLLIEDIAADPVHSQHCGAREQGLRSLISYPIILPDGRYFGTLCAIDRRPVRLDTSQTLGRFALLTELIAFHLAQQAQLDAITSDLRREAESAELREQFIAILGHDLRNPLASISAGLRMLRRPATAEAREELFGLMDNSVTRMSRMIGDVTDFARARIGSGMVLTKAPTKIAVLIAQAVDELRVAHPSHYYDVRVAESVVHCDAPRVSQILSNLLANAVHHGFETAPIAIEGRLGQGCYEIGVSNAGEPIPPELLPHLFKPFVRREHTASQDGLGLGLYIANEIARAHGGHITSGTEGGRTIFTLHLPL